MGISTTAQINVRLDRALKEAGDAELARMGVSPSQIVRALWESLSRGGERLAEVRRVLFRADEASGDTLPATLEALDRLDRSWEQFATTLDLDPSSFAPMDEEGMREARYEHLLEKYGE